MAVPSSVWLPKPIEKQHFLCAGRIFLQLCHAVCERWTADAAVLYASRPHCRSDGCAGSAGTVFRLSDCDHCVRGGRIWHTVCTTGTGGRRVSLCVPARHSGQCGAARHHAGDDFLQAGERKDFASARSCADVPALQKSRSNAAAIDGTAGVISARHTVPAAKRTRFVPHRRSDHRTGRRVLYDSVLDCAGAPSGCGGSCAAARPRSSRTVSFSKPPCGRTASRSTSSSRRCAVRA